MQRPEEPTREELDGVTAYWRWVEEEVRSQGHSASLKPSRPTQETVDKVGRWKHWRDLMECGHTGGITLSSSEAEMTCSDCGEAMSFLSETQIEEMRRSK